MTAIGSTPTTLLGPGFGAPPTAWNLRPGEKLIIEGIGKVIGLGDASFSLSTQTFTLAEFEVEEPGDVDFHFRVEVVCRQAGVENGVLISGGFWVFGDKCGAIPVKQENGLSLEGNAVFELVGSREDAEGQILMRNLTFMLAQVGGR